MTRGVHQQPLPFTDPDGTASQPMSWVCLRSLARRCGLAVWARWPQFGRTAALNVAAYCAWVKSISPVHGAYESVGA